MLIHLPNPYEKTGVFTIDLEYNTMELMGGGVIVFRSRHDSANIVFSLTVMQDRNAYRNAIAIIGKAMSENPEWFTPSVSFGR